jgi:hypothetical protein
MSEAVPMVIADLEVSEISEQELENTFQRVCVVHKDAVRSIQASMQDADDAYRKYLEPNYVPLEDVAKKDRASLNKAEKDIADQYAILKRAYEKPLANIEENVKQIRKAIKDASAIVDNAVKTYKDLQDKHKKTEIEDFFATKKFDLVPLEKIFDSKWLNKTKTMKEVREELDAKISAIYRDIEILEKIPDHGMAAKAFYLENLDMGAALRQVEAIKANAAKLAKEQVERDSRKIEEQVSANARAERQERREEAKEKIMQGIVDQAVGVPVGTAVEQESEDIIEYTATFKGTKEQLKKLRKYMTDNGIAYYKGLRLESEDDAWHMMKVKNVAGRIYYLIYVPAA